jgi:hypothetical protein
MLPNSGVPQLFEVSKNNLYSEMDYVEARTGDVVCVWAYFVGGVLNVFSVYHLKL